MFNNLKFFGVAICLLLAALQASAQQFPDASTPIKIVVPYTAGGSSDFVARIVASRLTESIKHSVVVENKPGASTLIGGDYVAKSKPDGYTIFLLGELTNASLVPLNKTLPYDPTTAFSGITNLVESPLVVAVYPGFAPQTLQELVSYARANPGRVNYGSAGAGNTLHLAGEQFASVTGVKMTHVPYKGASQALIDLVGGRIDVMFDLPQTPLPNILDGKLRALAVTTSKRLEQLPNVPTTAEAGLPQYRFTTRIGLALPAKPPAAIVNYLYAEVAKVLADPKVVQLFEEKAMFVDISASPSAYDKDISSAVTRVTKLLRDAGVEPQ